VATREGLDSQMDPLVSLQIVVAVERLRTLIAFKGAVVLLLLLVGVSVHGSSHVLRWVLHVHAAYERHLVSRVVHVRHDGSVHGGEVVATVRRRPCSIALWRLELRVALSGDGRDAVGWCLRGAWRLLSW